ncbi:uncharacterized protein LOC134263447 [Saccostrea cucullata]|uniref:uncharacterized protein LOC134263447 n=1 Tax=Saccostrea cuccullata TaxID=36930 RepID=UPI002ED297BD
MDQVPRISEAVYSCMCHKVGTPTVISIRREVSDIAETIKTPSGMRRGGRTIVSGSSREGFGTMASDLDFMNWPIDHQVIWDLDQADKYDTERCTLILMECSEERPGFALLQLLTPTNDHHVRRSCVRLNDGIYVSSAKYREYTGSLFRQDSTVHGPSESGRDAGQDYDFVHCFSCKSWPVIAFSFILRCQSQNWPPKHIVRDINNSGCHVVPVGFKGSPQEDCEWRISFSVAEYKLVSCMNHTQFMCYGLLKLFLKEVLTVEDTNGQPLLCSYFMKTVLFWVIQNNTVKNWNPSSLLSGFWLCFKCLLSFVYHGYLPNFFITKNNMFITKVFGHSQQLLCDRLLELYNLGIACLLHCHSIRESLTRAIYYRQCVISTNESEFRIDYELFNEINKYDITEMSCLNSVQIFTALHFAIRFSRVPDLSPRQGVTIRKYVSSILRHTVYHIYNTSSNLNNKSRLKIIRTCLKMLKVSAEIGFSSDRIYLVLFLYSIGKDIDAIQEIKMIKRLITQPFVMTGYSVDEARYFENVRGLSLNEKMRIAVAMDIRLPQNALYMIKELELEIRVSKIGFILVPPYIMTLMLIVLCYRGNPNKQQEALSELFSILHSEEQRYIDSLSAEISWQILGICQQICGDHQGALLSYQTSLKQVPLHKIQEATYYRIQDAQQNVSFS